MAHPPLDTGVQREATPQDTAENRPFPQATAKVTAEEMGPLQKACRDAGLPAEPATLDHLEQLARKAFNLADDHTVTLGEFRKAARLHRRLVENPRQFAKVREGLTVRQAKATIMREQGITTGRQWKKWKRQQQRVMRAEVRP